MIGKTSARRQREEGVLKVGDSPSKRQARTLRSLPAKARVVPFHVLLFATYPILSVLAANIYEVEPTDAIRPILLSIAGACLLTLAFRLVYWDWGRAAAAASVLLLLFFSYGHVYAVLKPIGFDGWILGRHRYLLPVWVLLFGLAIWFLQKRSRGFGHFTAVANLVSLAALLPPIYTIAAYAYSVQAARPSVSDNATGPAPARNGISGPEFPDIYYIITDSYARQDVLAERFGYDNSEFIEFLESRGFYVADKSMANYMTTYPSLGSALNMAYTTADSPGAHDVPTADRSWLKHSLVRTQLENRGYQAVAFVTGYRVTELFDADHVLTPDMPTIDELSAKRVLNDLERLLLHASLARILEDVDVLRHTPLAEFVAARELTAFDIQREVILALFENLAEVPDLPSPKFVFAHIISPHNPYLFGPEGEDLEQEGLFTLMADESLSGENEVQLYLGQLQYVNKELRRVIDAILTRSEGPVVIVLQSDHGPGVGLDWDNPDSLEARAPILNAYHVPEGCRSELYPAISPVNTFRVLFGCVFGKAYPLLEDVTYVGRDRFVPLGD